MSVDENTLPDALDPDQGHDAHVGDTAPPPELLGLPREYRPRGPQPLARADFAAIRARYRPFRNEARCRILGGEFRLKPRRLSTCPTKSMPLNSRPGRCPRRKLLEPFQVHLDNDCQAPPLISPKYNTGSAEDVFKEDEPEDFDFARMFHRVDQCRFYAADAECLVRGGRCWATDHFGAATPRHMLDSDEDYRDYVDDLLCLAHSDKRRAAQRGYWLAVHYLARQAVAPGSLDTFSTPSDEAAYDRAIRFARSHLDKVIWRRARFVARQDYVAGARRPALRDIGDEKDEFQATQQLSFIQQAQRRGHYRPAHERQIVGPTQAERERVREDFRMHREGLRLREEEAAFARVRLGGSQPEDLVGQYDD